MNTVINILKGKKVNKFFLYTLSILICLRMTLLYNCKAFYSLLPILVCASFILILFNLKKFNKAWLKENYLLLVYIIIRIISICINEGSILNLKTFVYEVFFIIIVSCLLEKEKKDVINISKIIITINLVANVISIIYQYCIQLDFSRELFGIYTNPNGLANLTCISLILYLNFFVKDKGKLCNCTYIIFSIIIILLSQSRTSLVCISLYIMIKLLLKYNIISFENIKKIFCILIIVSILGIIGISYINRNNIHPTKFEVLLNNLTTNRYYLWKYSIFSLEKDEMLGIGENNIGKYRRQNVNNEVIESMESQQRINRLSMNNNHNGYLQLLVGNGWICFIIFIIYIFKNIKKMPVNAFMIVSFVLTNNIFENELILSQSICIFLLMYFLTLEEER